MVGREQLVPGGRRPEALRRDGPAASGLQRYVSLSTIDEENEGGAAAPEPAAEEEDEEEEEEAPLARGRAPARVLGTARGGAASTRVTSSADGPAMNTAPRAPRVHKTFVFLI